MKRLLALTNLLSYFRELNSYRSSDIFFTVKGDFCVVVDCTMLDYRKTQAGARNFAGTALVDAIESLEYSVSLRLWDSAAGVADLENNAVLSTPDAYRRLTALVVILDGIVSKVIYHLIKDSENTVDMSAFAINGEHNTLLFGFGGKTLSDAFGKCQQVNIFTVETTDIALVEFT